MQNRPAERLTHRSEMKSGGGITTITSIIAVMNFVLVIAQVGDHLGEDLENIYFLEMNDNLTW
jgi:hypothetical protein